LRFFLNSLSALDTDNPYFIDTTVPDTLSKTSFASYHPLFTDISEWPTTDSQNTLFPILHEDTFADSSLAPGSQLTNQIIMSRRPRQPSTWLQEYFVNFIEDTSEPTSFQTAVEDPSWRSTMLEEITAIQKNQTWSLTTLPPGKIPISTKWVYKTKLKTNGSVQPRKARLVCHGYKQQEGMDFQDTFAPVVKWASIHLLLALAALQQWNLFHMDVKIAFLAAELKPEEEVFVAQP
jgi:hypothetical protein